MDIHLYETNILFLFVQATNIESDEHKGRIAIGRLHAGVLRKGMDVRVTF
jgi:predicted membrane GTPase involved in stress response